MKTSYKNILIIVVLVVGIVSTSMSNTYFGFDLIHFGDNSYFVSSVSEGSEAETKAIKKGFYLVSINGVSLAGKKSTEVFEILEEPGEVVFLFVDGDLNLRRVRYEENWDKSISIYERKIRDRSLIYTDIMIDLKEGASEKSEGDDPKDMNPTSQP